MAKKTEEPEEEERDPMFASLPGEYTCPSCGKQIVHGSKPGVEVACQECGERSIVPEPS